MFEARDAAGKGGVVRRLTERVSRRVARVVAPPTPTERFLERLPGFEAHPVEQAIILPKRFLTASEDGQRKRFLKRIHDPKRQWKLSPMDVES